MHPTMIVGTVKKSSDKGLSRLKKALENNQNPLSAAKIDFMQTSCRILGIDSEEMIDRVGKKAVEKGRGWVRKVMSAIMMLLDNLGARVKAHKRGTPAPAMSTRPYDDMDVLAHSLKYL
jgi:hypothetical protein